MEYSGVGEGIFQYSLGGEVTESSPMEKDLGVLMSK